MPGVHRHQAAVLKIEDSKPDRYKHGLGIVDRDLVVQLFHRLLRTESGEHTVSQQCHRLHHKQCRRDTLAGNIRDHQTKMIVIDQEIIVKVAANLFCRIHHGKKADFLPFRERRKDMRKHILLDPRGKHKLRVETFSLRRDRRVFADIVLQTAVHFLHRVGQGFQLVTGMHVRDVFFLPLQILDQRIRLLFQGLNRANHLSVQNQIMCDNSDSRNHDNGNGQHHVEVHLCFENLGDGYVNSDQGGHFTIHIPDRHQCGGEFFPLQLSEADEELLLPWSHPVFQKLCHDFFFTRLVRPMVQEFSLGVRKAFISFG